MTVHPPSIAVIVPCHNESQAIGKVVNDLRTALPGAVVHVYDNNSSDGTADVARSAGAVVHRELRKGKGNVVRRAFADLEADVYLLIDGDDTYDAAAAPRLVERLLRDDLDQVVGVRRGDSSAFRPNHEFGNRVLNQICDRVFGESDGDMLSGYRAFSRRFVKSFPAVSREFEIETELTIHAQALRLPSGAEEIAFRDRAEGSESKLRTYRDGTRILGTIVRLTRLERPMAFYGSISALLVAASAGLGTPVVLDYLATGLVPRLPSLVVAAALGVVAVVLLLMGLALDATRNARHEAGRLAYMGIANLNTVMMARSDVPAGPWPVGAHELSSRADAIRRLLRTEGPAEAAEISGAA